MGYSVAVVVLCGLLAAVNGIKVSEPAPSFSAPALLPSGEFKSLTLQDYRAAKQYLIMLFYPCKLSPPLSVSFFFSDRCSFFSWFEPQPFLFLSSLFDLVAVVVLVRAFCCS